MVRAEFGPERFEDIEMGGDGLRLVERLVETALPAEGLAGDLLQPVGVDPQTREHLAVLNGKILADDADDLNIGELARGQRKVDRGAAERLLADALRSLNRIERDRTHDEYRIHWNCLLMGAN